MQHRLSRSAALIALTTFASLLAPGSASAAPTPSASSVVAAVANLSGKNYEMTLSGNMMQRVLIRSASATRFSRIGIDGEIRRVGGAQYEHLDPLVSARAAKARKNWLWSRSTASSVPFDPRPELGALPLAVQYGDVTRSGSTITVAADFTSVPLSAADAAALQEMYGTTNGQYVIRLDRSGRAIRIDGTETRAFNAPEDAPALWSMTISYARQSISAPPASQIAPENADSVLPALNDLEYAAYSTARTATTIAYETDKPVSLALIERAAASQFTPDGLTAQYFGKGLKLTMNDASICVLPDPKRTKAITKRC